MSKEKQSLFERIFNSTSKKAEGNASALESQVKEKLKTLVYDDEVVAELLPVFLKLHTTEGFNTVYELLEAKEKQIETISGGDWFKQETKPEDKSIDEENANDGIDPVDELLKQKYK
ncbi:MAG: hypothetical protein [Caudoviricetes sp.]|nr:MAG: hypothetical protein [Caudoviricetes sp.]